MQVTELRNRFHELGEEWRSTRADMGASSLLPDPLPSERKYLVVSVDDHLIEPPDIFEGRLPAKFQARVPRVVEDGNGGQVWLFEGRMHAGIGLAASAGRKLEQCAFDPDRYEFMRPGAFDPKARLYDMDLDGVYASACFPSSLVGFGGQRLQLQVEPEFAIELVAAVNDWHMDDWVGACPERLIPIQIPYLHDARVAAELIERNAARGFHAVSFPEAPHKLGLPSIHSGYWEPFFAACEATETVLCLHVGSSSDCPMPAPDSPLDTVAALFSTYAMFTAVDWLYSKIAVRFPRIRIAMSEGGIGWVPGFIDRLNHVARYQRLYGTWKGVELSTAELYHRNFWNCTIEDPATMRLRDVIGIDRIMVESDYPHPDTSWPDTQDRLTSHFAGFTRDEIDAVTWKNASDLFKLEIPESVIADVNTYASPYGVYAVDAPLAHA